MVLERNFRQIKDEGINTKGLIESMYSYIYNQEFVALPYTLFSETPPRMWGRLMTCFPSIFALIIVSSNKKGYL